MGVLSSTRSSDATKTGQTDDWDKDLEADIAEIIGIAVDHTISSPIFASGSSEDEAVDNAGGRQVNADGSINGVLRFLTTAATAVAASGVEFQTTTGERFKLCAMASSLDLYQYDVGTETWEFLASLNEGIGPFLGLSDVDTGEGTNTYAGHGGEFVTVHADEDRLTFEAIAPTASVAKLEDIGDVPPYPIGVHVGKYLKLNDDETLDWVDSNPGAGAQSIAELDDVVDTFVPSEDTQRGVAEIVNSGTPGVPNWEVVNRPGCSAYGVSIGLNSDPNLTYINPGDPNLWTIYPDAYKYVYFPQGSGEPEEGNLSAFVFNGGVMADDLCAISVPNNYPGLWWWTMEMGIIPNGDFDDFLISDVEVVDDQGGQFASIQTVGYHSGIWYWNTSSGSNRFYNFYQSYMVSKCSWFTYFAKETPGSPKFRIKIKAGRNTEPVSITTSHKINLLGVRMR